MSAGRDDRGRFAPASQLAQARLDARAELIRTLLADEDEGSLGMSILGAKEAERDLMAAIGQAFVEQDDATAGDMRDRLYRAQTLREICERLLDQVRS